MTDSGQREERDEPRVVGTIDSVEEDFLNSAEYQVFVASFLKSLAGRFRTLEAAWSAGDYDELQHLAHSLASADMFGLADLGRTARALERAARERDGGKAEVLLREFRELALQAAQ